MRRRGFEPRLASPRQLCHLRVRALPVYSDAATQLRVWSEEHSLLMVTVGTGDAPKLYNPTLNPHLNSNPHPQPPPQPRPRHLPAPSPSPGNAPKFWSLLPPQAQQGKDPWTLPLGKARYLVITPPKDPWTLPLGKARIR